MDMQKEREAFEEKMCHKLVGDFNAMNNCYNELTDQLMWEAWQAAKASAVPDGFVLLKKSERDREVLELIDERDHFENQAEQLKDKLQKLYGVDFGEHSSCNFPFQNAIDFDDSDYVLVPKKATPNVIKAMRYSSYHFGDNTESYFTPVYEIMIEAAQEQDQ